VPPVVLGQLDGLGQVAHLVALERRHVVAKHPA
jgi:hypothetical protein